MNAREKVPVQDPESTDTKKKKLDGLLAHARVLSASGFNLDEPGVTELRDELNRVLRRSMPFIKSALESPELRWSALEVCYELMTPACFDLHADTLIASKARDICNDLELDPARTPKAIQILKDAFENLTADSAPKKSRRDATLIETAFASATEDESSPIRLYLSEANGPNRFDIPLHLDLLDDAQFILSNKPSEWVQSERARILTSVLLGMHEDPTLSPDQILSRLIEMVSTKQYGAGRLGGPFTILDVHKYMDGLDVEIEKSLIYRLLNGLGIEHTILGDLSLNDRTELGVAPDIYSRLKLRAAELFITAHTLEIGRPGIVRSLAANFGLRWISRYPGHVLIQQSDAMEDKTTPYCLMINSIADWNESKFGDAERDLITSLHASLKKSGRLLRIAECKNIHELKALLEQCHAKYGATQPIELMILSAHGRKDNLELGPEVGDGDFTSVDAQDESIIRSEYFKDTATVLLNGCSIGRKGGLAEKLSKHLGVKVFAPKNVQSGLCDIEVTDVNGTLKVDAQFNDERGFIDPARVYINGKVRG